MDIRKFFSPTNVLKKEATRHTKITSKDSVKEQGKVKKRRLVIDSDSDEEPIPAKKTGPVKVNGQNHSPCKVNKSHVSPLKTRPNLQALKKYKREDKSLKPVSSNSFFKSPPTIKLIIKDEPVDENELEIVDDDFDETLKKLDKKLNNSKSKQDLENTIETNDKSPDRKSNRSEYKSPLRTKDKLKQFKYDSSEEKKRNLENESKKTNKQHTPEKIRKIQLEVVIKREENGDIETRMSPRKVNKREPSKDRISKAKNNSENVIKCKEMSDASKKTPKKTVIKTEQLDELSKPNTTPENKRNSTNYMSYLHREGPQALGSKEIPEGGEDCLEGLTFLITGVLESFERDETRDFITKYGGKVMSTLSKNTQYMVVGRDAGPAKLEKAEKLGTKLLNENELLDLIRTRPGKQPSSKTTKQKETTKPDVKPIVPNKTVKTEAPEVASSLVKSEPSQIASTETLKDNSGLMWVDKYKPTSLKQVIGQHGDRSCANKLLPWLRNWWKNNSSSDKKKGQKKWGNKEDGAVFKAALLSGPPGIGKTTTAQLACKEVGFQFIELNASDTRSKKSLDKEISELLQNQKLTASLTGNQLAQKHVIIFDEVDGMSGNEDRGGTQELIGLIKHSKIPVICICNDRQHAKIRSLANYCFDLRFLKPRVEQIKAAMMTLLHKEKVKVPPETLHEIIVATNQDMRQVLHHLSFLSSKNMADSKNVKTSTKDVKLAPFEVLRKVFSPDDANASINEKASLFFHDYSLAPLFVQENYAAVKPLSVKDDIHKHLSLLSEAADSISYADTIDRTIRSCNNWSLLPTEAIFASVIPGECMRGYLSQMIVFPTWLGKNSSRNRMDRVLQQIHMHTRLHISGNKTELGLDYMSQFKNSLTSPLIKYGGEGVSSVVDTMQNYYLLREDLDSIVELALWPNQTDPMTLIEPKIKGALTRTLNKASQMNPYSTISVKKGKKRSVDTSFDGALDEDGIEEDESDVEDDVNLDAMVKQKKQSKSSTDSEASTSKGKGRGKSTSRGTGRSKK